MKTIGYVVRHKHQGIVGVAVQMAGGVLVHIRHEAECSSKQVEYTEFLAGDLDEAIDMLDNISLSYSDFNIFPIGLQEVGQRVARTEPSESTDTGVDDEEFARGLDDLDPNETRGDDEGQLIQQLTELERERRELTQRRAALDPQIDSIHCVLASMEWHRQKELAAEPATCNDVDGRIDTETPVTVTQEGLTHQDAIIVGVAEHPLTAEEDQTFLDVLDYLADEPEYWLAELRVMARIYNRLNPSDRYEVMDDSESVSEPLDDDDCAHAPNSADAEKGEETDRPVA